MDSPSSSPRATPWTTHVIFVLSWIVLHGVLLIVLVVSLLFYWSLVGMVLLPISYALLMAWYRPSAQTWGLWVCVGMGMGVGLASLIDMRGMLLVVILGITTGLTTFLRLPWRGLQTALWPLINTLAASAASLLWLPLPWNAEPEQAIGVAFLSGALYGLITGPALVFFLRDDPPAPDAIEVQDDQPAGRTEGIDVR